MFRTKLSGYLAPSLLAALAVGLIVGAEATAQDTGSPLSWSPNAASFEQHLQRRYGNALFPPQGQRVTLEELAVARARDQRDVEEISTRFQSLLERILQSPNFVQLSHANALREEVDELIERAVSVGGSADDLVPKLEGLRSSLLESMKQTAEHDPDAREGRGVLLPWCSAFHEPVVLQIARKDGPIPPEDLVPRILSEDRSTIRAVASAMPPAARELLLQEAQIIAKEARQRGYPAAKLEPKLETLRAVSQ